MLLQARHQYFQMKMECQFDSQTKYKLTRSNPGKTYTMALELLFLAFKSIALHDLSQDR